MTTIEAIDRLNSWLRSESARGWWASPRHAIYDWKHDILRRAVIAGDATSHAVYLSLKCRDCGGSKRYTDSSGFQWPHCRRCSSTGVSRLEFAVIKIGPYVWHTPRDKAWDFRLPEDFWSKASLSVDWEPNGKGRDLELWEVVEALNVCEMAVLRGELCKPGSHGVYECGDWIDDARHDHYRLYLGRSEAVCQFCGRVGALKDPNVPHIYDGSHYGVIRTHVEWTAFACDICRSAHDAPTSARIFDAFRVPAEKLDHPEIRAWLARRGIERIEDAGLKTKERTLAVLFT